MILLAQFFSVSLFFFSLISDVCVVKRTCGSVRVCVNRGGKYNKKMKQTNEKKVMETTEKKKFLNFIASFYYCSDTWNLINDV